MTKFLLLLGVSGVGKTTIIKELLALDTRYIYISPFITRPLRQGETDKVQVTEEELQKFLAAGKILAVNDIYGIRYGTPREPIEAAFREGKFPLLDWPIKRLFVMEQAFKDKLFRVYLEPPSITELKHRIGLDERDPGGTRLIAAISELEALQGGHLDGRYDYRAVSLDGLFKQVAAGIHQIYLGACRQ